MFQEFESVTKAQWKSQIEKDLKGKPYQELIWQLSEKLAFEPFYQRDDLATTHAPFAAKENNDWDICEWIEEEEDYKKANAIALNALMGGANALEFVIDNRISLNEMTALLEDIELPYIAVHFFYTGKKVRLAQKKLEHFYTIAKSKGYDTRTLRGSLHIAPYGKEPNWDNVVTLLEWAKAHLPSFKIVTINGAEFHLSDANVSETLAKTIQRGSEALHQLTERGWTVAEANNALCFNISIGKSYFINIAKIRALKLLWLNVLSGYAAQNAEIPPIMANFATLEFDENENNNMIRATTMALSAAIGGVDTLSVLAADKRGNSTFVRRIARNVQHLLKMESYIDKVADPAAGAYYIEQMTNDIAAQAWEQFKQF
jgi:methylmalonyl-CoA mutase